MKAYFTVGISASGKSTWASNLVSSRKALVEHGDSSVEIIEVNRDDIRKGVLFEKGIIVHPCDFQWNLWKWKWEDRVTEIQREKIKSAAHVKRDIVISDTNLNLGRLKAMSDWVESLGYNEIEYVIFDVDFDTVLERDTARKNGVGVYILRDQWARFKKIKQEMQLHSWFMNRVHNNIEFENTHVHSDNKIPALMFDIDGTIAHMKDRSPFEWHRVGEDEPDSLMCFLINSVLKTGSHRIVFMSGRDSVCREQTVEWINKHIPNVCFGSNAELFMREQGDSRKDHIIKKELFFSHVDLCYNVHAVFDDRPQVVRVWHDIGLKVWSTGDQLINF